MYNLCPKKNQKLSTYYFLTILSSAVALETFPPTGAPLIHVVQTLEVWPPVDLSFPPLTCLEIGASSYLCTAGALNHHTWKVYSTKNV